MLNLSLNSASPSSRQGDAVDSDKLLDEKSDLLKETKVWKNQFKKLVRKFHFFKAGQFLGGLSCFFEACAVSCPADRRKNLSASDKVQVRLDLSPAWCSSSAACGASEEVRNSVSSPLVR